MGQVRQTLRGLLGVLVAWAIIFYGAASISYWQGWLFFAVVVAGGALVSTVVRHDPELLKRRMNFRERSAGHMAAQIVAIASLLFIFGFSPFDHRIGWSHVPAAVSIIGAIIAALAFVTQFLVLRENRFASATIEISEGQHVVSTGIYAYIRHPWYLGLIFLALGAALTLGSFWALLALVPLLATLVWRLRDEETFLMAHLTGYSEYMILVRYRLIPGIY